MFRLRFSERVLLHLVENWKEGFNNNANEPPFPMTQAGIAGALGYSLERVSTALRELIGEGLVVMRKRYSRESGRFRNFYFPAPEGSTRAAELIEILGGERVKVLDQSGLLREMSMKELITYLGGMSKGGQQNAYELKERMTPELTYTNILSYLRGETFDVEKFLAPKGVELNKKMWIMVRDAYFDAANKYVVLTRNQHWQAGIIWLREGIKGPFVAEFRYRAGGGSGGDGLVFMFYKKRGYWPSEGGNLGFVPGTGSTPGYGVEFDSQPNPDYNDPPYPHIALVRDRPDNHLAQVEDSRVGDFSWHRVMISVQESFVGVDVDGEKVLEWRGELSRAHPGIGIAASTGGMTNWHTVDDIRILKLRRSIA